MEDGDFSPKEKLIFHYEMKNFFSHPHSSQKEPTTHISLYFSNYKAKLYINLLRISESKK